MGDDLLEVVASAGWMCRLVSSSRASPRAAPRRREVADRREPRDRGVAAHVADEQCAAASARMPSRRQAGCRAPGCRTRCRSPRRGRSTVGRSDPRPPGSARRRRRRGAARRGRSAPSAAGCSSAATSSLNGSATPWRARRRSRARWHGPSCGRLVVLGEEPLPQLTLAARGRERRSQPGDPRDGPGDALGVVRGGTGRGDGHGKAARSVPPQPRLRPIAGRRRRPGASAPSRTSLPAPEQKRDVLARGRAQRHGSAGRRRPAARRRAQPLRSDEERAGRGSAAVARRAAARRGARRTIRATRLSAIVSRPAGRRAAGRGRLGDDRVEVRSRARASRRRRRRRTSHRRRAARRRRVCTGSTPCSAATARAVALRSTPTCR